MGVPFLPVRNLQGTDTFEQSAAKQVACPFTGLKLALLPALYPDVALIHVHESDPYGNCRIRGITTADFDMARAAKRVIITCERVITTDEIRSDPNATTIPYFCVDAVCHVPCGSYPGNMPGEYFSDEEHLKEWLEAERDEEEFRRFLDRYVYGVSSHEEYVELCGGADKIERLRAQELLLPQEG